jgi:hypothetical protein
VSAFWTLPGPASFLREIDFALCKGKSIVLQIPKGGPRDVEVAVRSAPRDAWRWLTVDAAGGIPPLIQVRRVLADCGFETTAHDVRELVFTPGFDGWALWIDSVTRDSWLEWRSFLSEFEAASRERDEIARSVLVLCLRGWSTDPPPRNDVALQSMPWRGRVGEFDALLHCASRLADSRHSPARRRLLAQCAARVALWDTDLADRLLAGPPRTIVEPWDTLRSFAVERGWGAESCRAWCDGTEQEFDGSVEEHSAFLVGLGSLEKVQRRLWSAQAAVLLPILEERRQALIPRVVRYLRPPFTTITGEIVSNVCDLEIGQISYFLNRDGGEAGLRRIFRELRDVRNALAHLEPVPAIQALSQAILG